MSREKHTGSVRAPAGFGKTSAIVALAQQQEKKPCLILTHTNAGVAVIRKRLGDAKVNASAYRLYTIDSWSQRIVRAFPVRANYIINLEDEPNYLEIKTAVLNVLTSGVLRRPLYATYSKVLVDEYQDCDSLQHALIVSLAEQLPVRVFGDPLQAIFDMDGGRVDWAQVETAFPPLSPLKEPWRWINAGCPELGKWVSDARERLEAGVGLDLSTIPNGHGGWVASGSARSETDALNRIRVRGSEKLLIVASANAVASRVEFARRNPGVSVVERADLPDLLGFVKRLAQAQTVERADVILALAESVMTRVERAPLLLRLASLQSRRAQKPAEAHEQALLDYLNDPSPVLLRNILVALAHKKGARVFRPELFYVLLDVLGLAKEFCDLPRLAAHARDKRRFGGRRLPVKAVGSTLLLKGLEAEHVLVLNAEELTSKHLYVAVTRGARSVTVIANGNNIVPSE